jgi:effector-binding domain-containing protein
MKKTTLIISIVILALVSGTYLLIPGKLIIHNAVVIEASDAVAFKFLIKKDGWAKWWPGAKTANLNTTYTYEGLRFSILKTTNSGAAISIEKGGLKLKSNIAYTANDDNIVKLNWDAEMQSSFNPFKRITGYVEANNINHQISEILQHLKLFLEDRKNAYGYNIYISKVKDPILLTTATTSDHYPSMAAVYELIGLLRRQIKERGAKEMNYPMINITKTGFKTYQVSAAISINKELTSTGRTFINKMVAGGNLLEVDVKGGPNTTADALIQAKTFMKDHNLTAPAMPFESLITDRMIEKDTTKWVTKIYYPIF